MRYRQKRQLFIVASITLLFLIYHYSWNQTAHNRPKRSMQKREDGEDSLKVVVVGADNMQGVERRKNSLEGQGCNIPKLEQNGSEMMKFMKKGKPLDCERKAGQKNWVFIDEKGFMMTIDGRKNAKCTLTYFETKSDYGNFVHPKKVMKAGSKMEKDFAVVECKDKGETWEGLLMSVARKEDIVTRLKKRTGDKKSGVDRLDVVFLGFDSMSHQHFRRKMPVTIEQLNKMGSVIFNGYNIVGDGTPQAFIPILTGKTELELPNTRKRYSNTPSVDVYPFVWKNFSDAGYVTLYGEDAFELGTFTFRLRGFKTQPTDHYTRPFFKEVENTRKWGDELCFGSEPGHKSWFRYAQEFLREYKDMSKFLVLHQALLSHSDDVNRVEVEDEDFANSLASMDEDGLLDNAVLIVMGDHGNRFMDIRNTHQGQLEERLPMFSVRLPRKFRETELGRKIQANLEANKDRLTTPFDVHATFLDIMNLPKDVDTEQDVKKRSLSMLRPIPGNRNCAHAGVEPHWCTCLNWKNATATEKDQEQTIKLAKGLVSAIDSQLANVPDLCAEVTLKSIISAQKLIPNDGLMKYKNAKDADGVVPNFFRNVREAFAHYQLKIVTSPNDAVYEATVFFDGRKNELEVDLTSLSHVNRYGDDPHCIIKDQFALAHFCVCYDKVRT